MSILYLLNQPAGPERTKRAQQELAFLIRLGLEKEAKEVARLFQLDFDAVVAKVRYSDQNNPVANEESNSLPLYSTWANIEEEQKEEKGKGTNDAPLTLLEGSLDVVEYLTPWTYTPPILLPSNNNIVANDSNSSLGIFAEIPENNNTTAAAPPPPKLTAAAAPIIEISYWPGVVAPASLKTRDWLSEALALLDRPFADYPSLLTCGEFVSLGMGAQSAALGVLNAAGKIKNPTNVCVFADTGNESPETMEFAEKYREYAKRVGLDVITVNRRLFFPDASNATLEAYCLEHQIVPSAASRWCTDKFKLVPISKLFHCLGREEPIAQVGITLEEKHRALLDNAKKRYPLLELGLTRADCQKILEKAGLPKAPKSGCWICCFMGRRGYKKLYYEHPDLAERAVALEVNAVSRKNPSAKKQLPLFGRLAEFYSQLKNQMNLPGFDDEGNWQGNMFKTDGEAKEFIEGEIKCASYSSCGV